MDNTQQQQQIDPTRLLKLVEEAAGMNQEQLGTILNLRADVALLRDMVKQAQIDNAMLTEKLDVANKAILANEAATGQEDK